MYCRKQTEPTKFKMPKEEFNSFVNNITTTKINNDDMEVEVGVIVRTSNTNEILIDKEGQAMLVSLISMSNQNGYFMLIQTIKDQMENLFSNFKKITLPELKKTVLMPIGTFIKDNKVIVYFNLIVDMEVKHLFDNEEDFKFVEIDENFLRTLKGYDIIVSDTIKIV